MNKKKKPIKKTPYDIRQNTAYFVKNRLPAFILAGLIIFWTIASIFGLIGYCRSKPKNTAMVTASADVLPTSNQYVCDIDFFQGLVMYDPVEYYVYTAFIELRFEGTNEAPNLNVEHYDYFTDTEIPFSRIDLVSNNAELEYFYFHVYESNFESHFLYDSVYYDVRYYCDGGESIFDFVFYFIEDAENLTHTVHFDLTCSSPLQYWFSPHAYSVIATDDTNVPLGRYYSTVPYGESMYYYKEYREHLGDYDKGYKVGYENGLKAPNQVQFNEGYEQGRNDGYENGYQRGKADGLALADVATFEDLMSSVFDVPIRAFTSLFNFDILGVNMANFFLSILTLCIVLAVVKMLI